MSFCSFLGWFDLTKSPVFTDNVFTHYTHSVKWHSCLYHNVQIDSHKARSQKSHNWFFLAPTWQSLIGSWIILMLIVGHCISSWGLACSSLEPINFLVVTLYHNMSSSIITLNWQGPCSCIAAIISSSNSAHDESMFTMVHLPELISGHRNCGS